MIEMKVVKKNADGVKNQFVVKADEPVTIEFLETEKGHALAHVYRGSVVDEHSEPVGAFDSEFDGVGWKVD